MRGGITQENNWLKDLAVLALGGMLLLGTDTQAQALWKPIPESDDANKILQLVRQAQPSPSDLPENSTYNYIWAQHMMAWMVAERSGLMSSNECCARLSGLLKRVGNWKTYHGFYYDKYNSADGSPASDNVYFQGWWIWALLIARESYPCVAEPASNLLSRFDYDAAGMVSSNHQFLVADRNARTGAMTYYIRPTGDISGELRTAVIGYTFLTGDITPWRITNSPAFIDVGGRKILSVYHHFTFDPFYVHSCFPEAGYFQKSYDNLVKGANVYREQNGMTFYATRMEPLQAWESDPAKWPNTEHRVSKPWTAWLSDSDAPVMERAWIPGYGVVQYYDNWNFSWGYGEINRLHSKSIGGIDHAAFEADLPLEILPDRLATHPPELKKLQLYVQGSHGVAPLVIKLNGDEVARITDAPAAVAPVTITFTNQLVLKSDNTVQLESSGANVWHVGSPPATFHYMKWWDERHAPGNVPPIGLTVWVTGQHAGRENPYAFLCRAGGSFKDFPWLLLAQNAPDYFGNHLVAWVGSYCDRVKNAHVIYNLETVPTYVTYTLSPWEINREWQVRDYDQQGSVIPSTRQGNTISWRQAGNQCAILKSP